MCLLRICDMNSLLLFKKPKTKLLLSPCSDLVTSLLKHTHQYSPRLGSRKWHMLHRKDPPLIKSSWALNGQISPRGPSNQTTVDFSPLGVGRWGWVLDECACLGVSAMPSQRAPLVRNWAVPSCCRHKAVAVQSTRCKIETPRPSQKPTKAGGWWLGRERGDTAVSRAYTSLLNMGPPYICCNLAPVSARSEDKRGPRHPPPPPLLL